MKKIPLILILCLWVFSCDDLEITNPRHPDFVINLSTDKDKYYINRLSGNVRIEVKANADWHVTSSDDSWISYSPKNGSGDGIITIDYSENTNISERYAEIFIIAGEITQRCLLIQESLYGMIFVKGDTFQMGSNDGEDDEKPVHTVIVNDFYMSKFEVTQQLYMDVIEENPSKWKEDSLPVEQVSWFEAVAFCNALSQKEGLTPAYTISGTSVTWNQNANGYRLPTEAEWEYAAGGGSSNRTKWAGTNSESSLGNYAWYDSNSDNKTHPVGTKQPNSLGLYDMSGNVWEWCWDWYRSDYYSISPSINPIGPSSSTASVLRGGSWYSGSYFCRINNRVYGSPTRRSSGDGFRFIRNAP